MLRQQAGQCWFKVPHVLVLGKSETDLEGGSENSGNAGKSQSEGERKRIRKREREREKE